MTTTAALTLEHYTLTETPEDPYFEYWLEHVSGEGMSVGAKELDQLFDQYFKENF